MGFSSAGCGYSRLRSLIERTGTPSVSSSKLRGAPPSVVERQRSGSSFRAVAPWAKIHSGRSGNRAKICDH